MRLIEVNQGGAGRRGQYKQQRQDAIHAMVEACDTFRMRTEVAKAGTPERLIPIEDMDKHDVLFPMSLD